VGGSFQQYFYNRYKIVVYTGLRSDSIKNHVSHNEARRITATHNIFTRISCTLFTCDIYMCRLRHINDPVFSSLKMEGIRLLFMIRQQHDVSKPIETKYFKFHCLFYWEVGGFK
jgi:hypothetical protein